MATLYEIDEKLANIFVTPEGTAVDGSTGGSAGYENTG